MLKMKISIHDKLELFKKLFPHEKITTIVEKSGTDNDILEINDEWICKSTKTEALAPNIKLEAQLLKLLENKLQTTIPVVAYHKQNVLIYKKIPGTELTIDFYNTLSQKQKEQLAYGIAFFLHEFHNALNVEQAKKLGLTTTDWPWSVEKLQKEGTALKDIELKEIFDQCIRDYGHFRKLDHEVKLIHNDMDPKNIIIDEHTGALSGIIDFTDVALDDPYFDLRMRYSSTSELAEAIARNYAKLASIKLNVKKIYIYYMATEFSRYLQMQKEQQSNELEKIKKRITGSISFL